MLGVIPAAGVASRLQPLGFSKELLPVACAPGDAPKAVGEILLERMLRAGADRVCFIIAPGKTDLLRYFGRHRERDRLFFVLQSEPLGLCDALFRAAPHCRPSEGVLIGLPDTLWTPADALADAPTLGVHLLTFPVAEPRHFDAVIWADGDRVARVEVKTEGDPRRRVWGAVAASGDAFVALAEFWRGRGRRDQFLGHLLNAWIAAGHVVTADRRGREYHDLGTLAGYRRALRPPDHAAGEAA